jgi:arabinofuranan 3-O-arabinosyltransferase
MGLRRSLAAAPAAAWSARTAPPAPGAVQVSRLGAATARGSSYRQWLAAGCLLLALMMFATRPGSLLADTKIDMAVNPLGFLSRAAHLWDPAQFGQLQDQAAGYFFPVGPFFAAGKLLAIPGWVVQRLWLTALAVAAFLGVVRLARRLELGTDGTRIAAGLAYALAPRALTLLGVNSGELLPAMMAPLVLIPLVRLLRDGQELGRPRRLKAAAQSAVAVALCSGINASAVAAVLVLAMIYVLTGTRSWSRWRVLAWWLPAVALATCWWSVPLLLLGRYGVSILPYTESAQVTTSVTSLSNTLRGTEDWDGYLVVNGSAWWPVGYQVATGTLPTLLTGLVAGLGLGGLVTRRTPERRFLICAVLAGLLIIGTGYVSGLGNPLEATIAHLINGPLAPVRNLHKFDPLIRLPLALGLAHVLASGRVPWRKATAVVLAAAGVALIAVPAAMTGFSQAGAFSAIPAYWTSAASWLTAHAGHQAVLEVPGARFGEYTWGWPLDDVLEPLFTGDWANDQLSTIGSAGNARLLSAIEQQLDAGQGSAGLTQLLASMGVRYLVVRNDLNPFDLYGAWPARIHDALATSPGLTKVAMFGTRKVGDKKPDDAVSNVYSPYPPVEIYQVGAAQPVASVVPAADAIRVFGGPESLLNLGNEGVLDGRPVLLNSDARDVPASEYFVTDSLRRKLRNFGEIRIDYSQTLTAADPLTTFEAADDYLEPSWRPDESVAVYHGIANVTASSSAAGIAALPGQSATGGNPFAAVDGDQRTMWESGALTGPLHQWLQISFDHPVDPGTIRVAFADSTLVGPAVTKAVLQTPAGSVTDRVRATSKPQPLAVPRGPARWLRITVAAVARFPAPGAQVGISEIAVPGVSASRTIMAPAARLPAGATATVLLAKAQPQPAGCVRTSLRWVCSPFLATPTEEEYGFDDGFTGTARRTVAVRGQAIMTSTALITRYAWPGRDQPQVTGSSVYTKDPEDSPGAAFDGSAATAWIASAKDRHPALTIKWPGMRTVRQVTISVPRGANTLDQVLVFDSDGLVGGGFIGRSPTIRLPRAVRADQLTLTFSPPSLPLQIAEVRIPGVQPLTAAAGAPVRLRCGLGPTLRVNGKLIRTSVSGTVADLRYGRPMTFTACGPAAVRAGQNAVTEPPADPAGWDVQSVLLGGPGAGTAAPRATAAAAPARTVAWTVSRRVLQVTAGQSAYLEVAQNYNAGWVATINGQVLRPVRLDGWEQAWLLPAGTHGRVTLTYRPDSLYRAALFGGLALLALILVIALLPLRRRASGRPGHASRSRGRVSAGPDRARRTLAGAGGTHRAARRARPVPLAARAGGLILLAAAGVWLGGYPGAVLLPVATVVFVQAGRTSGRTAGSRSLRAVSARVLYSWWLLPGLVLAAAASTAAGGLMLDGSALATALTNSGPQVLCLVVAARIAAGLVAGNECCVPGEDLTD